MRFWKRTIQQRVIKKIKRLFFLLLFVLTVISLIAPKIQAFDIGANNIGKINPVGVGSLIMYSTVGNDYLYLCQYNAIDSAFLIYDVSTIASPILVSKCLTGDSRACAVNSDETIAIVGRDSFVEILDISNKSAPIINQTVPIPGGATIYDIIIINRLAYCAAHGKGLIVINFTDINTASIIFTDDSSYIYGISFDPTRNIIYAAARIYFRVYDLYSNGTPSLRNSWFVESYEVTNVETISSTRVAFGDTHGLVYLFDSTNLDSFILLGFVDVGSETGEILYSSGFGANLLVADIIAGLSIVDLSSETDPILLRKMSSTEESINGVHVTLYNEYILLAAYNNLLIYRLSDCLATSSDGIPSFQLLFTLITIMMMIPVVIIPKKRAVI
ncbi:MAG TPA: hypothetical protein VMV49_13955 [Candidatus Deferrimicrobium sp.]|nr:hypothetical protein [Candidatus Deferrimicrobium sp.]